MRVYEDPKATSRGRMAPSSWYIPGGVSRKIDLDGVWRFKFFESDADAAGLHLCARLYD